MNCICKNLGYVISSEGSVERCDSCKRFASDKEAQNAIARSSVKRYEAIFMPAQGIRKCREFYALEIARAWLQGVYSLAQTEATLTIWDNEAERVVWKCDPDGLERDANVSDEENPESEVSST